MIESLLGIDKLNPVQKKALKTDFLNGSNLVVSSPTGSGKTLIAEMAMEKRKKTVYTCPLRAIASEKYKEFKIFERIGKKVAISIGDLDSSDPWLGKYDIIVTTNEKLDSLMRHHAPWLGKVDLLVVDEIHLIDSNRGPTLENVIMRFKYLFPNTQIIALSATIPNADEIANWLDAELVESDWRPVKLVKGVYCGGVLKTTGKSENVEEKYRDDVENLVHHFLKKKKNILVFTPTRKSAEATAERVGSILKKDAEELKTISSEVLHVLEAPTSQCKRLSSCILNGSAFHHAGLVSKQREIVENAFRNGVINVLCSTPTLAMGVNLPADVVIMKSLARYTGNGISRIPKREFFQCAGRAGRPQYSNEGLAILIARSEEESKTLWDEYINGKPEDVYSQMGREPVLRFHILASIAMHICRSEEELNALFMNSFFAFQYKDMSYITRKISSVIDELNAWGFIKRVGNEIIPTRLGARISELYIDPYSAKRIIEKLDRKMGEIGILYTIVDTEEMKPYLSIRKREEEDLWERVTSSQEELGIDPVRASFEDYYFMEKFKTATMLKDWVNEATEEDILEKYNLAPGILRNYLLNAEWMAYSISEISKLTSRREVSAYMKGFRKRIKYGVKEELLPLVSIKGIGKMRARKIYGLGIKKPDDILKYKDKNKIERLIGKKIFKKVLDQLE